MKNEIFVVTDTFFNYTYTNRDFSKFEFKGKIYNKSRLVNKVIKTFVEENPNITFAELEKTFPKYLQGSFGVFETKENAQEIFDRTGHKRYYLKSDEFIKLSDSIIATTNQWGIGNIGNFTNHVNRNIHNFTINNL